MIPRPGQCLKGPAMTAPFERAGVTLALFLASGAMMASIGWRDATGMPPAFAPEFFPRIVLWVLLALTALGLMVELTRKGGSSDGQFLRVAVVAAAMVAFAWAMMRLGFFLTGAGFSVLALFLMGLRNPLVIMAFALGVPGALVGLFNHVLIMPLPTSPFSYLF